MAEVILKDVVKQYDNGFVAVKKVNLTIPDKEFTVIVGPSGCGKTTTLRMIAGLEDITEGKIFIGDKVINHVSPKDRDIAMVFQNYALYPHMTVYENMSFGLKLRKYPKKAIEERVADASEILGITDLLDRKPSMLSGGQRQRVAVGRAIVRKPTVFLFDEPLSNLDAKLRVQMRAELQKLHNRLKTTMIYVTHDQMEAMTMGDRIVIMKDGDIVQVDSPIRMYNHPVNKFVAGFIGSPSMNFLEGKIVSEGSNLYFVYGKSVKLVVFKEHQKTMEKYVDKNVVLGFRPEHVEDKIFVSDAKPFTTLKSTADVIEPMGSEIYIYFKVENTTFTGRFSPKLRVKIGDKIDVVVDMESIHFFDIDTEETIV